MSKVPMVVLKSASAALSLLTKARCVESYSFSPEERFKMLYAWPVHLESNKEVLGWLSDRGIESNSQLKVKSYSVEYSHYKNKKSISIPELISVRTARDIIIGLILSLFPKTGVLIEAFWDKSKNPNRIFPSSTSDIEGMRKFSSYRDSMFGFSHPKIEHKYKMPAYVGEALFQEAGFFKDTEIIPKDRLLSSGDKVDKSGRSNRFIVHRGNKDYLLAVMRSTVHSVSKLTYGASWIEKLQEDSANFHKQKQPQITI